MIACKAGAADCVRLLVEARADATLFDDLNQRSCLHYAGELAETLCAGAGLASVLGALQPAQPQRAVQHRRRRDVGLARCPLHLPSSGSASSSPAPRCCPAAPPFSDVWLG